MDYIIHILLVSSNGILFAIFQFFLDADKSLSALIMTSPGLIIFQECESQKCTSLGCELRGRVHFIQQETSRKHWVVDLQEYTLMALCQL